MRIKRDTLVLTEDNFKRLLELYALWIIEKGPDRAKDELFSNMLTSETIVNLIFFLAVDRLHEIIEKSPAKNFNNFIKHF